MTAPASPPAPEDQGFAPPAPKRRRRTWIVVLVSVMAAIFAIAAVGTALFVSRTLPPYSAADDFMGDLVDGRFDAAADRLCRSDRDRAEEVLLPITVRFVGGEHLSVNPFTVDRDDDRATVEYAIRERRSGKDRIYALRVLEENGDWRPCPGAGR